MIKNAFHFILNALFLLKIFKRFSWLFGHAKNDCIRKIRKTSSFLDRKTSSRPIFFFKKKALYWIKASRLQLGFTILIALKLAYNRNKLFKTFQYCTRDMLNFDILDKGLSEFFLQHIFCIVFQQKCSSSHILLTDQMSLPDYVYFLR